MVSRCWTAASSCSSRKCALVDPLTGLPGPALLVDRVEVALARARRTVRRVAVFVLYDVCGIGSSDPPVRELAERLRAAVRPDDTVARVANRTFVVVCNEIELEREAVRIAYRLLDLVGDCVPCRHGARSRVRSGPRRASPRRRIVRCPHSRRSRMRAVIDAKRSYFAAPSTTTDTAIAAESESAWPIASSSCSDDARGQGEAALGDLGRGLRFPGVDDRSREESREIRPEPVSPPARPGVCMVDRGLGGRCDAGDVGVPPCAQLPRPRSGACLHGTSSPAPEPDEPRSGSSVRRPSRSAAPGSSRAAAPRPTRPAPSRRPGRLPLRRPRATPERVRPARSPPPARRSARLAAGALSNLARSRVDSGNLPGGAVVPGCRRSRHRPRRRTRSAGSSPSWTRCVAAAPGCTRAEPAAGPRRQLPVGRFRSVAR